MVSVLHNVTGHVVELLKKIYMAQHYFCGSADKDGVARSMGSNYP